MIRSNDLKNALHARMRIAMIGQKGIPAWYGGVERHVEELSRRLVRFGHEVTVYTRPYYTSASKKNLAGIRLQSLPSLHSKHFDAITHTFFSTVHAMWKNVDIYHYHGVGPSLLSFLPRIFRPHAKVVTTFHCRDCEHQKWGAFARMMLKWGEWTATHFAHVTIAVSREIEHVIASAYGKSSQVIPNGSVLHRRERASMISSQFGLSKDSYFLAVSRLVPHKGLHHLISAYLQLETTKHLVIAGEDSFTNAYVEELKRLAAGNPRIHFVGWQSGRALAELYSNAYALVQPSESEGMSMVVLEAMGYGCPVLASNLPSARELLGDEGIFFQPANVEELTRAMRNSLMDHVRLTTMAERNRKRILRIFHWDEISRQTSELYERLQETQLVPTTTNS